MSKLSLTFITLLIISISIKYGYGHRLSDYVNPGFRTTDIFPEIKIKNHFKNNFCSGVLISEFHVLTTLNCLVNNKDNSTLNIDKNPSNYVVSIFSKSNDDEFLFHNVSSISTSGQANENGVAILKLEQNGNKDMVKNLYSNEKSRGKIHDTVTFIHYEKLTDNLSKISNPSKLLKSNVLLKYGRVCNASIYYSSFCGEYTSTTICKNFHGEPVFNGAMEIIGLVKNDNNFNCQKKIIIIDISVHRNWISSILFRNEIIDASSEAPVTEDNFNIMIRKILTGN
ncbi:hypothetical protein HCN44_007330 [Aphidius gifuensis]|uniref:Peptidase S1 domain-containing protein n=1 Tax=Aphidius gifuensis TaxID=684658 RepID=A0A834XPE7_APHGI|nr:hypothetical protein HCN44_007330 [Aphidius gifuensis]